MSKRKYSTLVNKHHEIHESCSEKVLIAQERWSKDRKAGENAKNRARKNLLEICRQWRQTFFKLNCVIQYEHCIPFLMSLKKSHGVIYNNKDIVSYILSFLTLAKVETC